MPRKLKTRSDRRFRRRLGIRKNLTGTASRPRLSVFRSHKHVYAQIIRDDTGSTLTAASSLDPELRESLAAVDGQTAARSVGRLLGERAVAQGIKTVSFDRGGYLYHGRVQALAEGAREAGLVF